MARLREVLRRHGVPDASVSGSRLGLSSEYDRHGGGRRLLGYRCQASYAVETGALDDLELLIADVVDAGAHRIDGVEFDVRDRPALLDEARRRAVGAARRKAQVYAEAADARLGPVLHIQDVESEPVAAFRASAGGGPPGALAPGAVEVSARVCWSPPGSPRGRGISAACWRAARWPWRSPTRPGTDARTAVQAGAGAALVLMLAVTAAVKVSELTGGSLPL
ncbi:hypothetical protein SVIOM342S_04327 [Streptomyces violaceorubidus]